MASAGATAVVTGAASGIGAAVCSRLLADGHRVAGVDVDAGRLDDLPGDIVRVHADVAEPTEVDRLVAPLFEAGARALVHCAGVVGTDDIEAIQPAGWERVLRVNLTSAYLLSRAAVAAMRRRGGGRIVHFSSVGGQGPALSAGVHYSAAKAGVIGLTRTLARQVAPDGITVNVVSPGRIDTPMFRAAHPDADRLRGTVPLGRIGTPADVAGAVAFLLSDDAAFITGATIDVNGGAFMR